MKSVDDIIKTLSLRRRRKVRVRAADMIAEHKARAERTQAAKAQAQDRTGDTLADLIEQLDPDRKLTEEDRQWLDALPVGKEES